MDVKKLWQFRVLYLSFFISLVIFSLGFHYPIFSNQRDSVAESKIRKDMIKRYYALAPHDTDQESPYGAIVRRMIKNGELTWEELGFTERDLAKIERAARAATARRQYDAMQYDAEGAPFYAMTIRRKIAEGKLTWEELGFTEEDLQQRSAEARRIRNVEMKSLFST
jgi:hypothetical protein